MFSGRKGNNNFLKGRKKSTFFYKIIENLDNVKIVAETQLIFGKQHIEIFHNFAP